MGCHPILEHHRRVVAALMLTLSPNKHFYVNQIENLATVLRLKA